MNGLALIVIVCIPVILLAISLGLANKFGEKIAGGFVALVFLSLVVFENQIIDFLLHLKF